MADSDFKIKISSDGIDKLINNMDELISLQKEIIQNQAKTAQGASNLAASADEAGDNLAKASQKASGFSKALGKISSGASKIGNGLKKVGKGALGAVSSFAKFTGIGAAIGLVTGAIQGSQKAMDLFATATNVVNGFIGTLTDELSKNFDAISKQNGGFDATQKVLNGVLKVALNGLIVALQTIRLGILYVQKGWESSIFGSGDTKKIKELNKEIDATKDKIVDAGKEMAKGAKEIGNNFVEALDEVAQGATAVVEAVTTTIQKTDTKKLVDDAKRLVELQKQAALADAERQKIQLQYQQTQEKLRQLRDDESQGLEARIKANDDLLKSQEEQAKLERQKIGVIIAAAQAQYNLNKTNENLVALKQAQLQLSELDERITGQQSEALANQNSLRKEGLDIQNQIAEATTEAAETTKQAALDADIEQKKLRANSIKDEYKKAQELYKIEKERIERQRKLNEENFQNRTKTIDDELKKLEESGKKDTARYAELYAKRLALQTEYESENLALATATAQAEMDLSDAVTANDLKNEETKKENRKNAYDAAVKTATAALGAIAALQEASLQQELAAAGDNEAAKERIQKEYFEKQKKTQIAEALISTITGAVDAFVSVQNLNKIAPGLGIATGAILAALVTTTGLANIAKIKATQYEGGGSAGSESKSQGSKFANGGLLDGPSHSQGGIKTPFGELEGGEYVVNRNSTTSFLPLLEKINDMGLGESQQQRIAQPMTQPVLKTYVVASEMSSQQEADKRISDLARL